MKIKLIPDKRLFLMFLAINMAGYNYENNPNGEHEVRIKFKKKAKDLLERNPDFKKLVEIINTTKIPSKEYIRLVNLIMLPRKNADKKINNQYKKIFNSQEVEKLFQEYKKAVNKINDYKLANFNKELNGVTKFFNLNKTINLNIDIHLNLLESYNRGTNYFSNDLQIISTSLDFKGNVNWQTVRHEFMHILLKRIFKDDLKNSGLKIPVNNNYSRDSLRVKFEENFILATNLFFLSKKEHRDSNLKYFFDHGYKKIYKFYSTIEKYFITSKLKLTSRNLHDFLQEI